MKRIILVLMLVTPGFAFGWGKANDAKLPSMCDEWNVLGVSVSEGNPEYHTIKYRLTADTMINDMRYAKMEYDGFYIGAMREDDDANIYFIHVNTTHEYLLYAFHAKEGDVLSNLWFGGDDRFTKYFPSGSKASITKISDKSPRVFTLNVEIVLNGGENSMTDLIYWIEGVGLTGGPLGNAVPYPFEGDYGTLLLCAYKTGEHIYTSDAGEQYGCEYEGKQSSIDSHPIPSSTATKFLQNGQLFILRGDNIYNASGMLVK